MIDVGVVFWVFAATSFHVGAMKTDNVVVEVVLLLGWIGSMVCAVLKEQMYLKRMEELERKDGD